jgi:DNA polymerase bacteriophage-type
VEIFCDCETFSPVPLNSGLARYATQAELLIFTWAVDEDAVQCWDTTRDEAPPIELLAALSAAERIVFHNAQFDRTILERTKWWPDVGHKIFCSMNMTLRHGLPGGLDKLSKIFKLPDTEAKLEGREFIQLFCKLNSKGQRNTRHTHPQKWREFLKYATQDVRAMREIYFKCPSWNDSAFELGLTEHEYTINTRGVAADVPFATQAVRACAAEQERLGEKANDLTHNYLDRATQRDRLLEFVFVEHGVSLPDLKADTVERRLDDPELPELLKELLRVRLSASKSSTTKYKRILQRQVAGRMYFLLQIYGALRTGRYSGRDFQPQNLKRPSRYYEDFDNVLTAIDAVMCGGEELLLDDIMEAMSSCLRSVIVAAPGKKLVVSDLSNIEGRFLPWLAGDEAMLQYFREFDRGEAEDYYKVVYGRAFNVDPKDVGKGKKRQIGKVLELAFAIGGGVGAGVTAAATYKIDLEELAAATFAAAPKQILLDARGTWQWAKKKRMPYAHMLPENIYVALEALKVLWRQSRAPTAAFWDECQMAAVRAIHQPGTMFKAGEFLEFDRKGVWLRMRLPSGRYLGYPNVQYNEDSNEISYMAWNIYRKCWSRERTYGAKFASDARQGGSRDVMVAAIPEAEAAGYPVILTIHDELVTEPIDDPRLTAGRLSEIMSSPLSWAPGLPLAASGFEGPRYRKQ